MNEKKSKAPKVSYEYYFIRNSNYEAAVKEKEEMEKDGWHLKRWHYEAMTLTFILTMEKEKMIEEPATEEEEKPWRREIKK